MVPHFQGFDRHILSISRDKEMYRDPDPLELRPERSLGPSPQTDPRKIIFGFGGLRCSGAYHLPGNIQSSIERWHLISGLHFAEASSYLNISISCILAAFTIIKQLDKSGKEITPPAMFEK
jgi:hypothetical protein